MNAKCAICCDAPAPGSIYCEFHRDSIEKKVARLGPAAADHDEKAQRRKLAGILTVGAVLEHKEKRSQAKKSRDHNWQDLYDTAMKAGQLAAELHTPTPMIVQEHVNQLNDASPVAQQWVVNDGVCGFAWVMVKPGSCSFARWLVKHGHAKVHYYGGVSIWISGYDQSMERKARHAIAMAKVFNNAGIKAHVQSRMD